MVNNFYFYYYFFCNRKRTTQAKRFITHKQCHTKRVWSDKVERLGSHAEYIPEFASQNNLTLPIIDLNSVWELEIQVAYTIRQNLEISMDIARLSSLGRTTCTFGSKQNPPYTVGAVHKGHLIKTAYFWLLILLFLDPHPSA